MTLDRPVTDFYARPESIELDIEQAPLIDLKKARLEAFLLGDTSSNI